MNSGDIIEERRPELLTALAWAKTADDDEYCPNDAVFEDWEFDEILAVFNARSMSATRDRFGVYAVDPYR